MADRCTIPVRDGTGCGEVLDREGCPTHGARTNPTPQERARARIVTRARRELDELMDRPIGRSAPQLRVVRRRTEAGKDLLDLVLAHLDTVYTLANERRVAVAWREKVSGGGQVGYSLDKTGDPMAREYYAQYAQEVVDLIDFLAPAAHELVRFMKTGEAELGRGRGQHQVDPESIALAIEAGRRRRELEATEDPLEEQPEPPKAAPQLDDLLRHIKGLEELVGKHHRRIKHGEKGSLSAAAINAHRRAVAAHDARMDERNRIAAAK